MIENPSSSRFRWLCRLTLHRWLTLTIQHHPGWLEGRMRMLEYQVQVCSRCGTKRTLVGDCD